jgi:hypothetical protein
MTTTSLSHLGYAIEADGITADPTSLALLAHAARDLGVNEVLVDVMIDDSAPAVARVRAFARVSSRVADRLDVTPAARELAYAS